MRKYERKSVPTYYSAVLFVLFIFYCLGCVIAVLSLLRMDVPPAFSEMTGVGAAQSIWNDLVYFVVILLGVRASFGILLVPLVLLFRGFALTCSVGAMYLSYAAAEEIWYHCALPAVLQLPSLLCVAAAAMCLCMGKKTGTRGVGSKRMLSRISRDALITGILFLCGIALEVFYL